VPLPPQGIVTVSLYRKVDILKYIGVWPHKGLPYGRLEPDEGKLSRPVLRGLGVSNDRRLPGAMTLNREKQILKELLWSKRLFTVHIGYEFS
jgi:hypothetical protein